MQGTSLQPLAEREQAAGLEQHVLLEPDPVLRLEPQRLVRTERELELARPAALQELEQPVQALARTLEPLALRTLEPLALRTLERLALAARRSDLELQRTLIPGRPRKIRLAALRLQVLELVLELEELLP